jgi:hypothetical protein
MADRCCSCCLPSFPASIRSLARSLKMDGCNSIHTHAILDPAYEFMGDALNKTGRPVLYSCSWPDYIRSIAPGAGAAHNNTVDYGTENASFHTKRYRFAKTDSGQAQEKLRNGAFCAANTAKHCNIWRMYGDIQDSFTSMAGKKTALFCAIYI